MARALKPMSEVLQWRWAPFVGLVAASLLYVLAVIALVPTDLPALQASARAGIGQAQYLDRSHESRTRRMVPAASDSTELEDAPRRRERPEREEPQPPRGFSPPIDSEPDEPEADEPERDTSEADSDNGVTIIGARRAEPEPEEAEEEVEEADDDEPTLARRRQSLTQTLAARRQAAAETIDAEQAAMREAAQAAAEEARAAAEERAIQEETESEDDEPHQSDGSAAAEN